MAVGSLLTEQQKKNQPNGTQYSGIKGVSENTGVNMMKYQAGYQPTDRVLNAQNQLQQVQSQKPQGYNSKHADALDSILAQIQNPQEFKFSFNGDALWNNYKDMYTQLGRQASMDAMGQAAALTGGYGNSYAQQVGQQGYQQYLLGLGDKAMDIYDRAYARHRDAQGDLKDQYSLLSDAEQRDYDRYQDDYQRWLTEREFAAQQASAADETEYNRFKDERGYWQDLAGMENQDYWNETNFQEDVRRNNRDYDEDVRRNDRDYEEDVRRNNRDYEEDVRRNNRDYDESVRQFDLDYNERVRQFNENLAENARQFDANLAETQAAREENARQFDESLNWDKMSSEQKYAASYLEDMISNGYTPTVDQLKAAGFTDESAQNLIDQMNIDPNTVNGANALAAAQAAAGGGGGSSSGKQTVYIDNHGFTYTTDKNGNINQVDRSTLPSDQKYVESNNSAGFRNWQTGELKESSKKLASKLKNKND